VKRKKAKAPEPDLFSISARRTDPQQEPEYVSAFAPAPEAFRPSRIIQECEIADDQGVLQTYKIEKHEDPDGQFWKLFVWDRNDWRRLSLTDGDAPYIPKELLLIAEDMLDWAAGYTCRTRDLCEMLRSPQRDENIAL
jgi:hypothetical protein